MGDNHHLQNLDEKIQQLTETHLSVSRGGKRGSVIGLAYRLSLELVVGVGVGGFMGWYLDQWFSTRPLFLFILLFLGMVAGVLNMIRTFAEMRRKMGQDVECGVDVTKEKSSE